MFFSALIVMIGAYLLGSVNFAVIYTKAFTKKDVRDFGSGNAGSTNALRVGGKSTGILTFICDLLKGFLSAFAGSLMFQYISKTEPSGFANPVYGALLCGAACMLGHIFPLFFNFKGGKGVATGVGIFFYVCPIAAACGLAIFIIVFLISKTVSLSSLIATVSVVVISLVLRDKSTEFLYILILSMIPALLIIVKHIDNIKRLKNGTENKITFGGK